VRVRRLLLLLFPMVLLVALPGVAQASVPEAFCAGNGGGDCMNRAQGGYVAGSTPVITYTHDLDGNENFATSTVTLCNGAGTVTATCPFSNTSIDAQYLGRPTVVVVAYNHSPNLCAGDNGFGSGQLVSCPSASGAGGGNGTIDVLSSSNYLINRYNTNAHNAKRWVCELDFDQALLMDSASGTAGSCQWKEVTS
jgi:hypothetical protein